MIERHEPSFRVFVKFASSPAADMALARAEEFLRLEHETTSVRVDIAMTKIPKTTAKYLQSYLVSIPPGESTTLLNYLFIFTTDFFPVHFSGC